MDALDIGRVLRRRWKLTVTIAAVLIAALAGIFFLVPQQYRTTAISLVTPVGNATVPNPYASADKSQSQLAALLTTVLNAPETAQELSAAGANGSVQVVNGNGTSDSTSTQTDSPFLTITVTAGTANDAVRTAQLVRQRAIDELQHRQDEAKVDPSQRLTLTEVLPVADATTTRAAQLRAIGIVGALGLVLGIVGIVVIDRILMARASSRLSSREERDTATFSPDSDKGKVLENQS